MRADGDPRTLPLLVGSMATPIDHTSGYRGGAWTESLDSWTLRFDPAVDALALAQAWGWRRPYAVASDVHHQSWEMVTWTGEASGPDKTQIFVTTPCIGPWVASAMLAGRPTGPTPRTYAGESDAYDLAKLPAQVTRIYFSPCEP